MRKKKCQWHWESGRRCGRTATHYAIGPDDNRKFYYCPAHIKNVEPDPNVAQIGKL